MKDEENIILHYDWLTANDSNFVPRLIMIVSNFALSLLRILKLCFQLNMYRVTLYHNVYRLNILMHMLQHMLSKVLLLYLKQEKVAVRNMTKHSVLHTWRKSVLLVLSHFKRLLKNSTMTQNRVRSTSSCQQNR